MMFERLEQRGERLAQERVKQRRGRIAGRIEAEIQGVAVSVDGDAVEVSGRGLTRRYDRSAALRWTIAEACDER